MDEKDEREVKRKELADEFFKLAKSSIDTRDVDAAIKATNMWTRLSEPPLDLTKL